MQTLEQIAKIISYFMTLTAIPTLTISIGRYYYDKRKDGIEDRIKLGYLPLYEYFYYKNEITKFRKKICIATYNPNTLHQVLQKKVDKSVVPLKLAKLIIQYEIWIEIVETGVQCLNTGRDYSEENGLDEFYEKIQNRIYSPIVIDTEERIEDEEIMNERFPSDYIDMIEEALKKADSIEEQIEKFVEKKIGIEYKHRSQI